MGDTSMDTSIALGVDVEDAEKSFRGLGEFPLRPVTIRQVQDSEAAYEGGKPVFIIGSKVDNVKVVAHAISIVCDDNSVKFELDDSTGRITARLWFPLGENGDVEKPPSNAYDGMERSYVRIVGSIDEFRGWKSLKVKRVGHIHRVTDPHEIYSHPLEAVYATLCLQRGPPPHRGRTLPPIHDVDSLTSSVPAVETFQHTQVSPSSTSRPQDIGAPENQPSSLPGGADSRSMADSRARSAKVTPSHSPRTTPPPSEHIDGLTSARRDAETFQHTQVSPSSTSRPQDIGAPETRPSSVPKGAERHMSDSRARSAKVTTSHSPRGSSPNTVTDEEFANPTPLSPRGNDPNDGLADFMPLHPRGNSPSTTNDEEFTTVASGASTPNEEVRDVRQSDPAATTTPGRIGTPDLEPAIYTPYERASPVSETPRRPGESHFPRARTFVSPFAILEDRSPRVDETPSRRRDPYSHLSPLQREIMLQMHNASSSPDAVTLGVILKSVPQGRDRTRSDIEEALDDLVDEGYIYMNERSYYEIADQSQYTRLYPDVPED
ncbi:hypothetical protein OBBRIDRAFT_791475 [Obba rivulosa]|uniref:Replication protein A C-terminal domain-containing protein n=1 Tax=Obba rivulosa TaxID=1052685 RepID=A0A8E2B1S3_9APHY|nr:hypothetical protein OBBRIDRAFT_791475 [Obba rivulosa]